MKRIITKILAKLGYTIKRIEKPTKIRTISNHLINHNFTVDTFQYANMQSKHIMSFKEKLNGGGYSLKDFDCPICATKHSTNIGTSEEGFKWGVCKKCGLTQNYCRLKNEDINTFYESGEYQAICMGDLDDKVHFDLEYKIMSKCFIDIFKSMSIVPSEIKIMEIGCGSGGILLALKEFGVHSLKGYDIDRHRISYGMNFLEELEVADALALKTSEFKEYNYILLSNILEHLTDPLVFLSKLSQQLENDEIKVIIDIPNLETCYGYSDLFGKFLHIGHIWYFNSTTIERLLNQAGIKIDSIFPRKAAFTIICSKSSEQVTNTNNSYWNSISSINYSNYINR